MEIGPYYLQRKESPVAIDFSDAKDVHKFDHLAKLER